MLLKIKKHCYLHNKLNSSSNVFHIVFFSSKYNIRLMELLKNSFKNKESSEKQVLFRAFFDYANFISISYFLDLHDIPFPVRLLLPQLPYLPSPLQKLLIVIYGWAYAILE